MVLPLPGALGAFSVPDPEERLPGLSVRAVGHGGEVPMLQPTGLVDLNWCLFRRFVSEETHLDIKSLYLYVHIYMYRMCRNSMYVYICMYIYIYTCANPPPSAPVLLDLSTRAEEFN